MLSAEKNKILTQVGPGTPMGDYLRRYWHPIGGASDLGEDLVFLCTQHDASLPDRSDWNCAKDGWSCQARGAACGVSTCSGRTPSPTSRAGMRCSTGQALTSRTGHGGTGVVRPASTRVRTLFCTKTWNA